LLVSSLPGSYWRKVASLEFGEALQHVLPGRQAELLGDGCQQAQCVAVPKPGA
jgi:hypothetical protein